MSRTVGKVYLVGAGPGDPGLITQKGFELLKKADAVVCDALVSAVSLKNISAEIFYVGKRGPSSAPRQETNTPQSKINQLLIRLAKQGRQVVRLKGGDPFLFGRGSEELEALKKENIPFEVVPGVSSAMAVPAYVGIPLTDRRWASQVTFVTGQEGRDAQATAPQVDWKKISPQGTLIVLMGVSRWPDIQKQLLKSGWPVSKPVVAIESGTWPEQRVIHTYLGQSPHEFKINKLVSPAVIVVGEVARMSKTLEWLKTERPLWGKRVVLTRAVDQNQSFEALLRDKGADVYLSPSIRVKPLLKSASLKSLVAKVRQNPRFFDGIIFLSSNGVENFFKVTGSSQSLFRKIPVVAVGPKTAEAIKARGWLVKKVAKDYNSLGVASILGNMRGKRFLIPRVQNAPEDLRQLLSQHGAFISELSTYKTVPVAPAQEMKRRIFEGVDAITFTSGSTVRYFVKYFRPREISKIFQRSVAVSIGPMTTRALRDSGIQRILEASVSTTEGMVDTLCHFFKSRKKE